MSAPDMARSAAERVWAALPDGARSVLASGLSPTDLQTLLLDLVRSRAARVDPARLLRPVDRGPVRSPITRRCTAAGRTGRANLGAAAGRVAGVELSPLAPLGTCAAVGPVDQNRIVSTVRNSEVVSDPTNVLALEPARRRRAGTDDVHLAAHSPVLRAQRFATGFAAHFALLALVSSGRDPGPLAESRPTSCAGTYGRGGRCSMPRSDRGSSWSSAPRTATSSGPG